MKRQAGGFIRTVRVRGLLSRALADERGISLILALLTLIVLGTLGGSIAVYTTSNLHSTYRDASAVDATQLAEAGLNDALSRLEEASNPTTTTLLPSTTVNYSSYGGSVTYDGTAVSANDEVTWTISSTGTAGSSSNLTRERTLTQTAVVRGVDDGADGSSWSRFYQNATSPCLTIDDSTFVTNVATKGNLCIVDGGGITGANTIVDVGGTVTITGPSVTTSTHSPSAGTGWTNPTNVYTSNSVYATNTIAAGGTGANQDTTGFGLAIPSTAKILGIQVSVQRLASACCNAVQTIAETGSPTGGTFTIHGTPPGGSQKTSGNINYNETAAQMTTALTASTMYNSGNVSCSGGPLPGTAIACTFQGSDGSQAITLMSLASKSLTGGSSPNVTFTNTVTGSNGALEDATVQLLKAGSPVGSNKASSSTWSTSSSTVTYGSTSDLWGTTWTASDLNASNFGLRFAAKNVAAASATASLDYVSVNVTYNDDTNGIGTAGTPVSQANIGGTCTYNAQAAHTPCTSADHVYARTITTTAPASNPALVMPSVDFKYWWANAMPGPKHFCTNSSPGLSTTFFDNNASTTTGPDGSLTVNGEIAPSTSSYTCQVWSQPPTGGTLLGELSWNHTTHILTIKGTIFVDGNFRFDTDGEVVDYHGRATLMSSKDDEIDAVVCAGGTGTTDATSCLSNMSSWDPTQNYMVLMSEENNEYDQGGTTCSGNTPPSCYNGHPPGAFQGVLYSTADCLIHQNFQDSGPVICNTITLPNESGINPTFYTFPSTGNLTDGQMYSDTATATHFRIDVGPETG